MDFDRYLTPVAVVAHQTFPADAITHVLAAANLSRTFRADLVATRVHLPSEPTGVDVLDSHVTVELTAARRGDVSVGRRRRTNDASDENRCDDRRRHSAASGRCLRRSFHLRRHRCHCCCCCCSRCCCEVWKARFEICRLVNFSIRVSELH